MIKIVICDDERIFLDKLTDLTNTFFEKRKTAISIRCFDNSSDFISDLKNHTNLFLLDIMMPGNSGLELASLIRDMQPDAHIIFISSMEEAVYTTFKYSPLRFIRKEYISEELPEALNAFLSDYSICESTIEVNDGENVLALPIKSINYAESDKHYINLYTDTKAYTVRGKLSDYHDMFKYENIIHVNQSYMVNLKYIKKYDAASIILKNDLEINIGRKYKETFKDVFFKYKRKYYHADFI